MYADFEFYKTIYKGKMISQSADFNTYAERASDYIDSHTAGKASKYANDGRVKRCECAVAEALYNNHEAEEASKNTPKTSEKVGDYSVSYAVTVLSAAEMSEKVASIITRYLWTTGLLYRGL